MYSPMTPRLRSWIPPRKHIIHIMLDQPATVLFIRNMITAQITPTKPNSDTIKPNAVMIRIGRTLRLVIPSIAKLIIFMSG